jgi:hypothetical protein
MLWHLVNYRYVTPDITLENAFKFPFPQSGAWRTVGNRRNYVLQVDWTLRCGNRMHHHAELELDAPTYRQPMYSWCLNINMPFVISIRCLYIFVWLYANVTCLFCATRVIIDTSLCLDYNFTLTWTSLGENESQNQGLTLIRLWKVSKC